MKDSRVFANSAVFRYAAAVFAVAAALGIRVVLDPALDRYPFIVFTLAVAICAGFGGLGPGLLSSGLSAFTCWLVFVSGYISLSHAHPGDRGNLLRAAVVWAGCAILISQVGRWRREAGVQEVLLRGLVQLSCENVWMCGPDGRRESPQGRSLGPSGKQPAHRDFIWIAKIHPDDQARTDEKWNSALQSGSPFRAEFRARNDAGAYRRFDSQAIPVRDRRGRIVRWVGCNTDIHEVRELQRVLRDEGDRVRKIAAAAPGVICACRLRPDGSAYFPYASETLREVLGLRPADLTDDAAPLFALIHPDDQAHFRDTMLESARTLSPWRAETRVRHPVKGEVWIEGHFLPAREPDGSTLWHGFVTDISQRKSAERSALQWARAFEQAELAIALVDTESKCFLAVNRTYAEQRGYIPEEMKDMPVLAIYPPEDRERHTERLEAIDASFGHSVFESIHQRKDGTRFPVMVDLTVVLEPSGHAVTAVAIVHDLSGQKLTQQNLRRNEALYRAIARNFPDGAIFVVDPELRCTAAEGTLANALGLRCEIGEGRPIAEVMDKATLSLVEPSFRRALAGESLDFEIDDLAGRAIWARFVPLLDEAGAVVAAMALLQDLTERKRAENEIRRLNAELEERVRQRTAQLEAANKELEAFAYSVSHDLRAPLRGIDGWSLALLEDFGGQLAPKAGQHLQRVRSETQRMGQLIDDLLKLSRVTRAGMQPHQVDLSQVALKIAARLKDANPDRVIEVDIEPNLTAQGDTRLLEIALTNLLENAVKFTRLRPVARIQFGAVSRDNVQMFYVSDNGVGFNMAYAPTLFGAFQRLHKASEYPGTGIGLATVDRIIRRHGGRVWAEAEPGRGATFRFTLDPFLSVPSESESFQPGDPE